MSLYERAKAALTAEIGAQVSDVSLARARDGVLSEVSPPPHDNPDKSHKYETNQTLNSLPVPADSTENAESTAKMTPANPPELLENSQSEQKCPDCHLRARGREESRVLPLNPCFSVPPSRARVTNRTNLDDGSDAHVNDVPEVWLQGVAHLVKLPCPQGTAVARWRHIQMDAAVFTDRWAGQAARLGWGTFDIYGVNKVKPFERLDGAGLVRLLNGRSVVALTVDEAVIECPNGARQTFRRNRPGVLSERERALLWEIEGATNG